MSSAREESTGGRHDRGVAVLAEAKEHVVGGLGRMGLLDDPACFPSFFTRSRGPYVWDADGHQYIDLIAGRGAIMLGYGDEEIDRAVIEAIGQGVMFPLGSVLYPAAGRALKDAMPTMERVKFFRTGSCSVSAAIRLARIFTGRSKILTCGYHGWHDWFMDRAMHPADGRVVEFFYDLGALEELASRGDVAAIAITPEPSLFGPDFVQAAAEIAARTGAVFVLDEMRTAFRFSRAGYQALAGVRPDLTTVGKALSNGYALAALGGRADIMSAEQKTHISGTYEAENVGLAAAIKTLEILARLDFTRLERLYSRFDEFMNRTLHDAGVGARVFSSCGHAFVVFEDDAIARTFYREAARLGVSFYCFDNVNLMIAHEAVVDEMEARIERAVRAIAGSGQGGRVSHEALHRFLVRRRIVPGGAPLDAPVSRVVRARLLEGGK